MKEEEKKVFTTSLVSAAAKQEASKRWGAAVVCGAAQSSGRYLGPVFSCRGDLVQWVGENRVVVHRAIDIDLQGINGSCEVGKAAQLDGLVLSIYYIAGKGVAYCRSAAPVGRMQETAWGPESKGSVRVDTRRRICATRSTVLAVTTILILAACASKNKLITPNGENRVPINSTSALNKYQDLVARQDAMALERSELERRVESLSTQVAKLKAYVVEQERSGKAHENLPPVKTAPPAPPTNPAPSAGRTASEAVAITPDRIVFRVSHGVGRTEFSASATLEDEVVKAAMIAKSVSIRGRTDATVANEVESRIALERAVHARQFLVSNGVDATKIKTWYRAAGGFAADNTTAEGRSVNRRVEIEVRGLDTSAFASVASEIRVGRNQ